MNPASIVVDLRHIRCGNCKVAFHNELATACPVCGAPFNNIQSNHVGLADKLNRQREAAGAIACDVGVSGANYDLAELVGS